MKQMALIIFSCLFSAAACGSGKVRTLIVSGLADDPSVTAALQKLQSEDVGLHVRDVEIKRAPAQDFSVSLIGKDGGEKWRTEDARFQVREIFDRIDEMPMRQEEILRQRVLP